MFELVKVEEKDKNIIFNLMQLYTYELSFFEVVKYWRMGNDW